MTAAPDPAKYKAAAFAAAVLRVGLTAKIAAATVTRRRAKEQDTPIQDALLGTTTAGRLARLALLAAPVAAGAGMLLRNRTTPPAAQPATPNVATPPTADPAAETLDYDSETPEDYKPYLDMVNRHTNPSRTLPSQSTMVGSALEDERSLNDFVKTLPGDKVESFMQRLYTEPRGKSPVTRALEPAAPGARPLALEDEFDTDPEAWALYKDWARGRDYPVLGGGPWPSTYGVPGRDNPHIVMTPTARWAANTKQPAGLVALHEMGHVTQRPKPGDAPVDYARYRRTKALQEGQAPTFSQAELPPTLSGMAFAEKWYRAKQLARGLAPTGSGATATMRGPVGGPPTFFPPISYGFMHDKAQEHGLYDGQRSMAALLNTSAGRSWLKQQTGSGEYDFGEVEGSK